MVDNAIKALVVVAVILNWSADLALNPFLSERGLARPACKSSLERLPQRSSSGSAGVHSLADG